ncbi:low-affinity phosphate transporter [Tilletia horrida]|nr:low-affinity phosphate transporter [Tilletia horrida]
MKFSHSIQFNSKTEWANYYLAYSNLKKTIYQIEKEQLHDDTGGASTSYNDNDTESSALLRGTDGSVDAERIFLPLVEKELSKIVDFYASKEKELLTDLSVLQRDLEDQEAHMDEPHYHHHLSVSGTLPGDDDEDEDDDDGEPESPHTTVRGSLKPTNQERRPSLDAIFTDASKYNEAAAQARELRGLDPTSSTRSIRTMGSALSNDGMSPRPVAPGRKSSRLLAPIGTESDWAIDMRITFKKRISDIFVDISELKQYVELNKTGLKKILKKYDKITKSDLKERYLSDVVASKYPFTADAKAQLDAASDTLTALYANVVTSGDIVIAAAQLKEQLREQVVWQRNTVWREMIGIERRVAGAALERSVMGARATGIKEGDQPKATRIRTPCGFITLPSWLGISTVQLLVAFLMLVLLLKAPGLRFFERIEEQNCLALLVFCTILWATEVIPLFVTSLMVPLLVVALRVARSDDHKDRRLTANETTKWIFSQMFAPNMCLLLGGFTIAAALSKYGIDKILATKVLRLAGSRPSSVLLAHMGVACFASMWISNVAAPVLMYSLIQPILRTLPNKSPYGSALIMGIALASNIGGQTSPIASPQNLIALQYMAEPLSWLQWFAITIPVSGISLVVIWLVLLWAYGSGRGTVIKRITENRDPFSGIQYFIAGVSIATILLWVLERKLEWVLGDMGIIAIIPLVLFFGTGILTKEDFNNFLWTIVFLAMGGIALGKAVTSSGLLESLDNIIQEVVKGMPVWKVLFALLAICLVVATFISHTIAAVLLVPIAAQVGDSLSEPHPRLLIMATVLTASAAMGLPVSGFPNMTAVSMENSVGERYVTVKDFLRVGILASVLATLTVGSVGFLIMTLLKL